MLLILLLLVLFVNNLQTESLFATQTAVDGNSKSGSISTDAIGITGQLVFAHVIFRHGDRTPIMPYPTDPWNNLKDWPTGWGQLTNLGKQQQYLLGQWLRKRYDNLLGPTYSNNIIYVRSTDVDRTLMSALSNLAGLYLPKGSEKWNAEIAWQPIPVHTEPRHSDSILAAKAPCPAYDYEFSSLMNSSEFKEVNEKYDYVYKYLSKHTGYKVSTLRDVLFINNTLCVQSIHNKTLPEWTREIYPSADMTYLSELAYAVNTYTRKMARFKTGPLIKEMLQRFDQKAKGILVPDRNVWLYSAHDATVVNVLSTLKVNELHSPEYNACIMLELRIDERQDPYVSVFYKSSLEAEPKILDLPECGTACPLNKMFSLYEDILPIDWEVECKCSSLMLAMGVIMSIITVILIIVYFCKGLKKKRTNVF